MVYVNEVFLVTLKLNREGEMVSFHFMQTDVADFAKLFPTFRYYIHKVRQ